MTKKSESTDIQKRSTDIAAQVLSRVEAFTSAGELVLPQDYSAANALKSAMIMLKETKDRAGKPVLEVCTKESIATALLDMVVQGLSVVKKQVYFIPYGTTLQCSRSYQGSIAVAKRVGGVKDVIAGIVYEDDSFEFAVDVETGYKSIVEHTQDLGNIDNNKIAGAYAVILYADGRKDLEVMTIKEIKTAWNQGATKGNSPAHQNFTQEMCKKTVINRACKTPINSSSDANLIFQDEDSINHSSAGSVRAEIEDETAIEDIELNEVADQGVIDQDNNEESPY